MQLKKRIRAGALLLAAALAGGADLDALVTREMAAKRAEKEAKAKEGARG